MPRILFGLLVSQLVLRLVEHKLREVQQPFYQKFVEVSVPLHSNALVLHNLFDLVLLFDLTKLFAMDEVVFVFIYVDKLRLIMNLVGLNEACQILDYFDQNLRVPYVPIFYHILVSSLFFVFMAQTKKVVELTQIVVCYELVLVC